MSLSVVFILGAYQLAANLNRSKFVSSDAPKQNLRFAGHRIEIPPVGSVHQDDRQRPIFRADVQRYSSIGLTNQTMHKSVFLNELTPAFTVFDFVAARNDLLGRWSKDRQEGRLVFLLGRANERRTRFFRRGKSLLRWLLRLSRIKIAGTLPEEVSFGILLDVPYFCFELNRSKDETCGCDPLTRLRKKECREFPRGIHSSKSPKRSLAADPLAEPLAITTQEAVPVVLRKVAKTGILEIMRSLRIITLTPTRITRTGL
jgi:hypothetical protein